MNLEPTLPVLIFGLLVGARFGRRQAPSGFSIEYPPATRPRGTPIHHTIVELDVTGSGRRNDQLHLRMRADLRAIVADVLAMQRLDPDTIDRTDLGDGVRLVIPAHISPHALLDPFIPNLAAALRAHRATVINAARLRLRVAVHMGLLHRDVDGWAGAPLVHCARLLNAEPVRSAIAVADQADLVLVVSETIYTDVVRHGYGFDEAAYRHVRIAEKETIANAWIHIPGQQTQPNVNGCTLPRRIDAAARRRPAPRTVDKRRGRTVRQGKPARR